jgi:hypothetical protein
MTPRSLFTFTFLTTALSLAGCVSKSTAQSQARLAYLAGQRDAIAQMNQQSSQVGNVTFIGPVKNAIVPWQEGLTLGKAILSAVYESQTDPTLIFIRRSTEEIEVDPARLLSGTDFQLKPGDVVQFQLPASTPSP